MNRPFSVRFSVWLAVGLSSMFVVGLAASISSSILVFVSPLSFGLSFQFVYGFLCCTKACKFD